MRTTSIFGICPPLHIVQVISTANLQERLLISFKSIAFVFYSHDQLLWNVHWVTPKISYDLIQIANSHSARLPFLV